MSREATVVRRLAVYLPGLIIFALIQILPRSSGAIFMPDFLFIFPLLAGLWTTGYDGFTTGLFAGFLRDYLAGRGYGAGMLIGMFIGLLAGWLAREGWKQYLIRGSILITVTTFLHELSMSFLVWLWPLGDLRPSFTVSMRVALARYPSKLLGNVLGALILTSYFVLAFYRRKTSRRKNESSIEVRGGESLA